MSDPTLHLAHRLANLPVSERARALAKPGYRRWLTRDDPLAFALVYLRPHLRLEDGEITLSEFHEDLINIAKEWMDTARVNGQGRHAFIAPRGAGKSTWLFTILPLWAAAHGHTKFIAAFADSATQAEIHLMTLKRELDNNALLREDYPELCAPAKRRSGVQVSDNRQLMQQENGFVFAAKGMDSASLGLKVGNRRPDLILFDDVEPDEAQYSVALAKKRLGTIQDSILPMNLAARVVIAGTVTMPGSIVHQLVRHDRGEGTEAWITDQRIDVHYWPAILANDDGSERSVWPEKWELAFLQESRTKRWFLKNFMNAPVPTDSLYWVEGDHRYGTVPGVTRTVLSVDPAVTAKASSDETGLAVVGFSPSAQQCLVEYAEGVRLVPGEPLRQRVMEILGAYPHITSVVVEGTQGQQMWHTVLHDLPVRLQIVQSGTASKAVRASWTLQRYQQGQVLHAKKLIRLEEQQVAFTGREGQADDICDSVCQAVNGFFGAGGPAQAPLRMSVA